jgi:hypothetical protein
MVELVSQLSQVRVFIEQLATPFGFMQQEIKSIQTKLKKAEA